MQAKQLSSANYSSMSIRPVARGARRTLAALGAALLFSPAWADVAEPLASVSALNPLVGGMQSWARVPSSVVRVAYFRDADDGYRTSPATRIYVNGRFHTALQAGSYTVFCLPAGLHTLSSLDDPQSSYGTSANLTPAQMLFGGNTYVVRSDRTMLADGAVGSPPMMIDTAVRNAGRYSENQSRLLSRAQTVACPVQQALAQP